MTDTNGDNINPSTNGRDGTGKFLPGNKAGRGNPFAAEIAKYRAELYKSITPENITAITKAQIDKAEHGDTKSATLIYSLLGLLVKQVEANVTTQEITADEARSRVAAFFGGTN